MKKLIVAGIAVTALLGTTAAHADYTWKDYKGFRTRGLTRDAQDSIDLYFTGIGSAFMAANAALNHRKAPLLFCVGSEQGLQNWDVTSLLDRAYRNNPRMLSDDMPLAVASLLLVQQAYPCKQ